MNRAGKQSAQSKNEMKKDDDDGLLRLPEEESINYTSDLIKSVSGIYF